MKQIKKLLSVLLVLAMVIAHVPSVAVSAEIVTAPGGSADFNTINSTGSTSYSGSYTTSNGWTIANSAIHVGGTSDSGYTFNVVGSNNSYKAPCLNGKTTATGKLTSPTLTTGISKLTIQYTKMFTDTKLGVNVTIKDAAGNTYTHVIAKSDLNKDEKYVVYTDEWTLDTPVVGNFTMEVVNNCPSKSTSNKDRITILSLAWDGAVNSGNEGGSGGDEGGSEPEEPTKFDVSFDLNGAEGDALDAIQVEEGKAYGELPAPTREGYTFVGWFTEAACTNAVNAETIVTQSHTLYAKWSKNAATHVDPATVTYTYGSTGSYSNIIKNWGIRGDVATSLSPNATAFYTGDNTYAKLSAKTGSATLSTVPQSDLYVALKVLMADKHTKTTTYDQVNDLLAFTDCQDGDDSTISLFYCGEDVSSVWDSGTTFNKEHCWPKSLTEGSNSTVGVDADIMTLRAAKPSNNSSRGDKPYGTASGSFDPNTFANGKYDLRGDCARILLYTYVRWGEEELNAIDSVELLLSWIQADPVDSWELARNDSVQSITGTRNVFVDYPQLAFILFGEEVPSDLTVPNDGAEADPEPTPDPTPDPTPVVPALGGSADFNALVINTSSGGDTGYSKTYLTANGWQTVNSAILVGGTSNSSPAFTIIGSDKTQKAVCLNGKTSAPGKLTSPVLTTGISKLAINYTMPFSDTKLSVTVTIKDATGNVHDTHVIENLNLNSNNDKLKLFEDEWVLQTPLAGAFTIEVVNNCPSGNNSNKDRFAILSLDWEGVASEEVPEIVIFNVSFDLNGAEGAAPATKQVVEGATYGTLPEVSREGYDFGGWFTEAACTNAVNAETIVTQSHTLYAKWEPKPVATISFDLSGAEGDAPEAVTVIIGEAYETLPLVSREGYTFGGWFTEGGTAVKVTDIVEATHTLYAHWIEGETIQTAINFSTTDQRTGFSEEQQVWENEGLTFTNNKADSSNAMGDYPNDSNTHVRLYKNSEVIIACEGMLQIQVVSEGGSEYKNAFAGSLTAAGLCYILNGNTFTIFLAEPTDTLTIPMSGGQVRLDQITVTVVKASDIVENWGLTLNDEIVANFNMTFTPEILADEQAYVEVKVGDKVTEVPVSEVNGPLQVAVYAMQMNDEITLCVVDGNSGRSEENTFTIRQYCETILASEEHAEYHQLVKEMLNYGGAAQAYFGHNTGDLASEGILDAGKEAVPEITYDIGIHDKIDALKCTGATLVYRDKIALRFYFEGSLEGYTFSATGAAGTPVVNVAGGYVEIADILPQDLDVEVTLEVTDAQGNLLQVAYSPMNYIVRMSKRGSVATQLLVKALYNYHLAAKALAG